MLEKAIVRANGFRNQWGTGTREQRVGTHHSGNELRSAPVSQWEKITVQSESCYVPDYFSAEKFGFCTALTNEI